MTGDRPSRKVVDNGEAFDTNTKRFYMPGVSVTWTCPECGTANEKDMS